MSDEIIKKNTIITSISLIIVCLFTFVIISYANHQAVEEELINLSKIVLNSINETSSEENLFQVVNKYTSSQDIIEIDLSNSYGYIIKSSTNDAVGTTIDDWIDKKELAKIDDKNAKNRIYINNSKMYYINKINDELIVRTSIVYEINLSYIYLCIFIMLLILILTIFLSIIFSKKTSQSIIDTFVDIDNHLKTINEGEYTPIIPNHKYPEVEGVLKEINVINNNIYSSMLKIKNEHNKLNYVYDNMNQGMIIVNTLGKVLLFNQCAKEVFKITMHTTNLDFHDLIDCVDFNNILDKSINNKENQAVDVIINNGIYACTINYLENKWYDLEKEIGVFVIMLIDITEKRKSEELKAEFVSNASHELKTPITSIRGFSELLLSNSNNLDEDTKKYLKIIYDESIKMKETIDELLYLSNLEYKKNMNEDKEQIYLIDFIDESVQRYQRIAAKDQIKIKTDVDDQAYIIEQPKLFIHLIDNLLSNAIKYNKTNGEVLIKVYQDEKNIILEVSDTGIGIEEKNLNKIFERFYRVEESHTTSGTGIGLNIVKQICNIMNANVTAKSTFNVGTTFTICFKK